MVFLPVSEGGDDQTIGAPQELIHVGKVYISDGDQTLVRVLLEVETWLLQPLKIVGRSDVHLHLLSSNKIRITKVTNNAKTFNNYFSFINLIF